MARASRGPPTRARGGVPSRHHPDGDARQRLRRAVPPTRGVILRREPFPRPRDVRVEEVPDATLLDPTDAARARDPRRICGSDLWPYRGERATASTGRIGHEFIGVVEDVGAEVRTLKPGDRRHRALRLQRRVCEYCQAGLHTSCVQGGYWGGERRRPGRGRARAARRRHAGEAARRGRPPDDRLAAAVATLTDVMGTGHHAARQRGRRPGRHGGGRRRRRGRPVRGPRRPRLGAERIIVLGRHDDRLEVGRLRRDRRGAPSAAPRAIVRVRELTGGGVPHVLECVGTAGLGDGDRRRRSRRDRRLRRRARRG